jgi:hypothetical protein
MPFSLLHREAVGDMTHSEKRIAAKYLIWQSSTLVAGVH